MRAVSPTMGRELERQADEQVAVSEGVGGGTGMSVPAGQPVASLPRLPVTQLPSLPDVFSKVGEILKTVWDNFTSWFSYPAWISDLMEWLDEAFQVLQKYPLLRMLFKGLGKVTPVISVVIGLVDIGVAITRWSTEGDDAGLQLFEGILTALSGGLGIAALFAAGSVVGIPLAVVLGAASLIVGYYSIVVGILRDLHARDPDFLPEHPEVFESGLPHHRKGLLGLNALPLRPPPSLSSPLPLPKFG